MQNKKNDILYDTIAKAKEKVDPKTIPLVAAFKMLQETMEVIMKWCSDTSTFDELATEAMVADYLKLVSTSLDEFVRNKTLEKMNENKGLKKVVMDNITFIKSARTSYKMTEETAEEFIKIEKKLDTVKVNKFIKENKSVPSGIKKVTGKEYLTIKTTYEEAGE